MLMRLIYLISLYLVLTVKDFTYGELCSTGKPDGKPFSSQQLVAHIVAAGQPEWAAFTEDLSLAHPEWRSFHGSI